MKNKSFSNIILEIFLVLLVGAREIKLNVLFFINLDLTSELVHNVFATIAPGFFLLTKICTSWLQEARMGDNDELGMKLKAKLHPIY